MSRIALVLAVAVAVCAVGAPAFAQAAAPSPSPTPSPSAGSGADSRSAQLEELKRNALVFTVNASIVGNLGVLWSADQTRVTVNGLSVTIRLESPDMLIQSELTPYRQREDLVFLVIKNEVWLRSGTDRSMEYVVSLKSALVKLGTAVNFYPLGRPTDDGNPVIKLAIGVDTYRETGD